MIGSWSIGSQESLADSTATAEAIGLAPIAFDGATGDGAVPAPAVTIAARHRADSAILLSVRCVTHARVLTAVPLAARNLHRAALLDHDPAAARHTAPSAVTLAARSAAPWSPLAVVRTRLEHPAGSAAPLAVRHRLDVGQPLPSRARHSAPSADALPSRARHLAPSADALPSRARHLAPSADALPSRARHSAPSADALSVAARSLHPVAHRAAVGNRHALPAALVAADPIRVRHRLVASLLTGDVRILTPNPVLLWASGEASPLAVGLSADQGSSVWLADIALAESREYSAVSIGTSIEIRIGADAWSLVVDEKLRERPDGYRLKAVSPLALLGAPWSAPVALGTPDFARAVCQRLLGQPIAWSLVDWMLPPSAAAIEATPLELARQIVETVGGVLESLPSGAVIARPANPTTPPTAVVAGVALLTDADLYDHREAVGSPMLADRFVVTSGADPDSRAVQIEIVRDETDEHVRTVRAYPLPWREIMLAHTGDAAVQIGTRAQVDQPQEETLEIIAGRATAAYPVTLLDTAVYRYVDLGAVVVEGTAVTTAAPAYSLLDLAYRSRAWQWRVEHPRIESIQFLALEP